MGEKRKVTRRHRNRSTIFEISFAKNSKVIDIASNYVVENTNSARCKNVKFNLAIFSKVALDFGLLKDCALKTKLTAKTHLAFPEPEPWFEIIEARLGALGEVPPGLLSNLSSYGDDTLSLDNLNVLKSFDWLMMDMHTNSSSNSSSKVEGVVVVVAECDEK